MPALFLFDTSRVDYRVRGLTLLTCFFRLKDSIHL